MEESESKEKEELIYQIRTGFPMQPDIWGKKKDHWNLREKILIFDLSKEKKKGKKVRVIWDMTSAAAANVKCTFSASNLNFIRGSKNWKSELLFSCQNVRIAYTKGVSPILGPDPEVSSYCLN